MIPDKCGEVTPTPSQEGLELMLRLYFYSKSKGKPLMGKCGGNTIVFVFLLKSTSTSVKTIEELKIKEDRVINGLLRRSLLIITMVVL